MACSLGGGYFSYIWNRPCAVCGLTTAGGCSCLAKYSTEEEHVPTQRSFAAPEPKCECGSGSNVRSGAHSHWCRLWTP